MDELDRKRLFARELLKAPGNPFAAALIAWNGDTGAACMYALAWSKDAEVLAEIEAIKNEHDSEDDLPTKTEAAQLAWNIANSADYRGNVRVDALRLYAEILAYMPEKGAKNNVNLNANNVMVVKDHGNPDEWEKACEAQQSGLINAN